jgi:hypothetical protein
LPVTQREKSTSGSGLLFPKAFLDTGWLPWILKEACFLLALISKV